MMRFSWRELCLSSRASAARCIYERYGRVATAAAAAAAAAAAVGAATVAAPAAAATAVAMAAAAVTAATAAPAAASLPICHCSTSSGRRQQLLVLLRGIVGWQIARQRYGDADPGVATGRNGNCQRIVHTKTKFLATSRPVAARRSVRRRPPGGSDLCSIN